jgi:hypothetical protein
MILERNPDAITQTPLTDTHETVFERAARCSDVAVSRFGECVFNLEVIHDTFPSISHTEPHEHFTVNLIFTTLAGNFSEFSMMSTPPKLPRSFPQSEQ